MTWVPNVLLLLVRWLAYRFDTDIGTGNVYSGWGQPIVHELCWKACSLFRYAELSFAWGLAFCTVRPGRFQRNCGLYPKGPHKGRNSLISNCALIGCGLCKC